MQPHSIKHLTTVRIGPEACASPAPHGAALVNEVYQDLRDLAARYLMRERAWHTLQPTALVHEAWLRLAPSGQAWKGKAHFMAAAAVAMRRILVDSARRRGALKRGSVKPRRGITTSDPEIGHEPFDVLELDELLRQFAAIDERRARVVELRVFAGMTVDEVAEVLEVARSTVADDWAIARAWLASRLMPERAT